MRTPIVLGITIVFLSGLAILSWWDALRLESDISDKPENTNAVVSSAPLETSVLLPPSLAPAPLSEYAEMVERPVFNASRRPVPMEAEIISNAPPPLGDYVLVGVITDAKGTRALLRDNAAEIHVVMTGQSLESWKVESIHSDRVMLGYGNRRSGVSFEGILSPAP